MRGALLAPCLWLMVPAPVAAEEICQDGAHDIARACFTNRTGAVPYGHDVLGDTPEWTHLEVYPSAHGTDPPIRYALENHIFEDLAPRIMDLDADGKDEIVGVQSSFLKGARLSVFGLSARGDVTLLAATPYIGRRNRWLAPLGAADLDGDGHIELAFVDRPHLAKTLRVWRYKSQNLDAVASAPGFTNHRIGAAYIVGGIRTCGNGAEMLTADAGWRTIMATRLKDGVLESRALGPYSRDAIERALSCQ